MLGKNFYNELVAAGLGTLAISWSESGEINGRENLTPEQSAALDAVIAAHTPVTEEVLEALADLADLDVLAIRPLRAIVAGVATDIDRNRLASLEATAVALRSVINNG